MRNIKTELQKQANATQSTFRHQFKLPLFRLIHSMSKCYSFSYFRYSVFLLTIHTQLLYFPLQPAVLAP